MKGIGQLVVTDRENRVFATWVVEEGGGVTTDIGRTAVSFVLERAPLPSEFDIREMSAEAVAEFLVRRIREERERAEDAYDSLPDS